MTPVPSLFLVDDTMICYGMYGCFSISSPWTDINRPVTEFPDHPAKISPRYCLHTRYNRNYCQYLDHTNRSSIYRSFFTPFHKTYVVTHGFLENGDKPWLKVRLFKFSDFLFDIGGMTTQLLNDTFLPFFLYFREICL